MSLGVLRRTPSSITLVTLEVYFMIWLEKTLADDIIGDSDFTIFGLNKLIIFLAWVRICTHWWIHYPMIENLYIQVKMNEDPIKIESMVKTTFFTSSLIFTYACMKSHFH